MSLSPRQKRFAEEYVLDFNGKKAAIRAGYSPAGAKQQAHRLLTCATVHAEVDRLRRRLVLNADGQGITAERVLSELAKIAFADFDQVKPAEKRAALVDLGRHLGLFARQSRQGRSRPPMLPHGRPATARSGAAIWNLIPTGRARCVSKAPVSSIGAAAANLADIGVAVCNE